MIERIRQGGAIAIAAGLLACGGAEEPGEVPADTTAVGTAPTTAPAVAGDPDVAAVTDYSLVVTNPMPHTMIVTIQHDGLSHELGAVPANGETTFAAPVAPGATVTLIARDEAETHSPTATLTLPATDTYAVWRIE